MSWHACSKPDECLKLRKTMNVTPGSSPLSIRKGLEQKYEALHQPIKEEE